MSETCPRRDRWFRGCRFEPRYDTGKPPEPLDLDGRWIMQMPFTEPRIYVRDVCVTCGRTIERAVKP
jgi:hypothetical protein